MLKPGGTTEIRAVPWGAPEAVGLRREFTEQSDLRLYPLLFGHLASRPAWDADDAATGRAVLLTLVADVDGRPAGHAALRTPEVGAPEGALEVTRVFVRAGARRRGVASMLLAHLVGTARDRGAKSLVLGTGPSQPEAIATYRRHGFRPVEPYPPYDRFSAPPYDMYGPALCFAKPL
ncbi:Acetyltransferase (GNAT) family protein [Paraoerskovia marina]|uniref:Acetyltransferase (GNAT) family protein n=1 Tax=Paraoerskovia marina TaxID=545619 RepID=A0A1H1LT13_9CELL|nr:GNAT family N-acetyltransferase [Paraoerskovia marina]SDR77482.1 Acetyltransferase (GNAT) family protein [Paraoerskovia marina]SDS92960.1 Acetyltransferase (GNAT) family protein [Paraoerskovia marina]